MKYCIKFEEREESIRKGMNKKNPICFSTFPPSSTHHKRLKTIWIQLKWINIGVINRHHSPDAKTGSSGIKKNWFSTFATGEKKRLLIKTELSGVSPSSSKVKMKIKSDKKMSKKVMGAAAINPKIPFKGLAIRSTWIDPCWLALGKVLNCS